MIEIGIIDAHVHCDDPSFIEPGVGCLAQAGVEKFAVQSRSHMGTKGPWQGKANANPVALAAKAMYPERAYAFGAINHHPGLTLTEEAFGEELAAQVKRIRAMGCDGVKMLETKPSLYVTFPYRVGHAVFEGFFESLAAQGLPLMWHVGDPASFWDPAKATERLRRLGWYYGEGGYPGKEELYEESLEIVTRHPGLTVVFAHFYFLSGDLARLGRIFDAHPNLNVDITPGSEMYMDFSRNAGEARAFFIRYKERLFFGTDLELNPGYFNPNVAQQHIDRIRCFLETRGNCTWDDCREVGGLELPADVLGCIYGETFERIAGKQPRRLDRELALAECDRLAALSEEEGAPRSLVEARRLIAERG